MEISREIATGYMQANKLQSPRQSGEKDSLAPTQPDNGIGQKKSAKSMDKLELSGRAVSQAKDSEAQAKPKRSYSGLDSESAGRTENSYGFTYGKTLGAEQVSKQESMNSEVQNTQNERKAVKVSAYEKPELDNMMNRLELQKGDKSGVTSELL